MEFEEVEEFFSQFRKVDKKSMIKYLEENVNLFHSKMIENQVFSMGLHTFYSGAGKFVMIEVTIDRYPEQDKFQVKFDKCLLCKNETEYIALKGIKSINYN